MTILQGLINFGGGGTGTSSSTSGITSINSETGPAIIIQGSGLIDVEVTSENTITISSSGVGKMAGNFTNITNLDIVHGFQTEFVIVQVYDSNNQFFIADKITVIDANTVRIETNRAVSGKFVVVG